MRLRACKAKVKMVGVTSVGPFSLTNQIGERDRFYQMFSPKTNFCVRDYRVLYGGSKVSRQFQLRSRQFQFHHGNFNFTTAIVVVTLDPLPTGKWDLTHLLCFVCDLYSHSETAYGKSLWIHKKEQKNYPWRFPNQVVGFSSGLSNHKSSSTNRVEIRKPQHMLGTFLWCCAEIAENILARTKFKTRGIKHGQLSRFTVSIFYSSLLWIPQ